MIPKLSLLVLRCADLDRSVAFYRTLGFEFNAEKHGSGPEHFACENNGLVIELYPVQEPNDAQARLGFQIGSLETAALNLRNINVESQFKNTSWGARLLTRDPDGRIVELSQ